VTAANVTHLPEPQPPRKAKKKASAVVAAQQAEADDGFVTIELRGITLRVPVGGKVSLEAIDLFRDGDNYAGTRAMLGEEQWKRLKATGATAADLDELGLKLKDATGN
jgi:hypothetical protein